MSTLCPTTKQVAIDKIEKIKAKKAKIKAKAKARKAAKNAQKTEPNFDLNLPDDFDDSSDDGSVVTVVSPEDRVKEKQDRPKEQDDNTYINGSVKKMLNYPDLEVKNIIENIKAAKDTENTVQGYVSKNTNFRSNQAQETFLFDTGATVSIIGLQVAEDNGLQISKLKTPRNIIEASGANLNIVGQCEFFIKLRVLGKTKKLNCLVFRGNSVDREILISGKMLKLWRMIHPTFPHESIEIYINKL